LLVVSTIGSPIALVGSNVQRVATTDAVAADEFPVPEGVIGAWDFRQSEDLPIAAPGRTETAPRVVGRAPPVSERLSPGKLFLGHVPTDRVRRLLAKEDLPVGAFSVEMWVNYHVDQPVGAAVMAIDADLGARPYWLLGFHEGEVYAQHGDAALTSPAIELKSDRVTYDFERSAYRQGVSRYWHHLVGVFAENALRLYHNGVEVDSVPARLEAPVYTPATEFEVAGYLEQEPHMKLGHLVRHVAIYDRALSANEVELAFRGHAELVEKGILVRGTFHFTTTAPQVQYPEANAVQLLWETDRPASAVVSWGRTEEMPQRLVLENTGDRLRRVRIEGLEPDSIWFYRVVAISRTGQRLDSGRLQFRTPVESGQPFVFAAFSDTETRPFVAARLARAIWEESPHLLINAGDLTDSGHVGNRVEWTHEYFEALGHFGSRVPVLPVMGNGEDDFVWFGRYLHPPGAGISYYAYRYGDVEFFVLDSNLSKRSEAWREGQRTWLRKALGDSTARWKIAALHHPPWPDRNAEVAAEFSALFEAHGIDLVLAGHHHRYVRSWPLKSGVPDVEEGIVHLQLGGGGGNLSARPATADVRWAKTYQGYGYSLFRVHGDRMTGTMHDDQGAVRDVFELVKTGPAPARLAPGR
jgi:hypothetical protein